MNKKISSTDNDRLLEYLDGTLSAPVRAQVEQALQESELLRQRLDELRAVDVALRAVRIQEPSRNFTHEVMANLSQAPARQGLSTRNTVLLLAGVMIAIGLCTLLLAAGVFDQQGAIELNDVVIKNEYIQVNKSLPSIPFNEKLIVNIIILLNIALAFVVIDRAILRPWFEKRANMNY